MGCDIHCYAEVRKDGQWTPGQAMQKNEWYTPGVNDGEAEYVLPRIYGDRNYRLFSILADVRNYFDLHPIDDVRGLPVDVSSEVQAISDDWGEDGHSHSFFTLAELFTYDWTQTAALSGYIDAVEYVNWTRYKRGEGEGPESWCADTSAAKVPEEEMAGRLTGVDAYQRKEAIEAELVRRGLYRTYTHVSWTLPYYKMCRDFWSDVIPQLLTMATEQRYDDVRIVFWFDN